MIAGAPWQSVCTPAQSRPAERLFEQDKLVEADNAFSILESECSLSPSNLLKWMRVKSVLGRFSEAGRIACLVVQRQPEVAFLVQEQLPDLLKDAAADSIRAGLSSFCSCALSSRNPDTAAVRQWIAGVYYRFGLYDDEANALLGLDSRNFPSAGDLVNGIRRRFARKSYDLVVRLAVRAYPRLKDEGWKSECALMLYQAYAQTGQYDSAGVWLKKVRVVRQDDKARIIVFCQKAGLVSRADSLISTLPPSFLRDTLELRQKLFSGDFDAAAAAAVRLAGSGRSASEKNELLLWRIRSLLFGGNGAAAEGLLDSVSFSPSMTAAEEFLSYKYRCAVLNTTPRAWGVFGPVSFAAWSKRPDLAHSALANRNLEACPPEARRIIVLTGVSALVEGRKYADARAAMERTGFSSADKEFRYYYGEILYNVGAVDSAQRVLQELLLTQPGDVFSEKARVFLLRMNGQRK